LLLEAWNGDELIVVELLEAVSKVIFEMDELYLLLRKM
jgi:hypothetical protein